MSKFCQIREKKISKEIFIRRKLSENYLLACNYVINLNAWFFLRRNIVDDLYEELLSQPFLLAEGKNETYKTFTERHLQAMWLEQKFFRGLKTIEGFEVEVLSPGIWNSEAGPDFRKAHLRIDGKDLRGDVELHLAQEGWVNHGHHLDPNYDDVIFHLSFWNPKKQKKIVTSDNNEILAAFIEDFLTVPVSRILKLIDLELYPYYKFTGTGYCAQNLITKLSEEKTLHLFSAASFWRLRKKYEFLKNWTPNQACSVKAGMAMALGYKKNSQTFLELYLYLLQYRDFSENELLAIGMGSCGFFEKRFVKKWNVSKKYQELEEFWSFHSSEVDHQAGVYLHQIRPLNHPVRRLVVLVKIIRDINLDRMEERLSKLWNAWHFRCVSKKDFSELQKKILLLLPLYDDSYWNSHYLFEVEEKENFLPLLGKDLRKSMLINTFLPLLFENVRERNEIEEVEAFNQFYFSFTSSSNSKSRYLENRFFGTSPKKKILAHSITVQGAYQIHRDFCVHYEASCEGCPFVENYQGSSLSYL
jgi:hypothetical protein